MEERNITHVLSLVGFNTSSLKNFKDEPWSKYGQAYRHLVIDIDDVDDEDLLVELPKVVKFIDEGLRGTAPSSDSESESDSDTESDSDDELEKRTGNLGVSENGNVKPGGVFVHCAAGKSRSAAAIIAYLLWRYPARFDPDTASPGSKPPSQRRPRKDTAAEAVAAALAFIQRTRPMAEPNAGFMAQLELWWEMGCPADVESHQIYKRWAYKREVEESAAVGQAPSRLRFEDEEISPADESGLSLRCKKCRRTLATAPFIADHKPASASAPPCQHVFVEPLGWMRPELEKGSLNGRLLCPNARCGAGVGRYDWKGFRCSCGAWVTPGLSLQRARVDEEVRRTVTGGGIRLPPGRGGNL